VSPHNILVGVDGVARLVDFGVAKAAGRLQTTREGQLKGKLAYMAPEQITGVVTRKTDVYAASVCLWEALTSRRLFQGDNDGALLHQVLNGVVRPPSEIVPALDPAWDPIVLRGLERDEGRRYATAREMAVDIETRLPLARATEVGVWVEALAHEKLAARAAAVKALESGPEMDLHDAESSSWKPAIASSHSPVALPAPPAEETAATTIIDDARPRESNTSPVHPVSWPLSASSGATRRSRAVFAVAGVGAVGVLVAVLVFVRPTNGVAASSSASAAAASVAPSSDPSTAPSSPLTPDVPAVASAPPVASTLPAGSSSPRASKASSARPPSPPTKATVLGAVLDTRH
jgi:eukaryotic-like serine/threonine-protein kinase